MECCSDRNSYREPVYGGRLEGSPVGAFHPKLESMPLFEMSEHGGLEAVQPTTFAAEHVLERADLQRALRARIEVIGEDLLVVAEEFGDFAGVNRRIDLLAVDRTGELVVIELKRTEDGGHMDLQSLRYAAMVSTMTFDQLADTYERHLKQEEPSASPDARAKLADFLEEAGGEDTVLERRVRIILVAAGFDQQITTTVLWLADVYGLDIRCVKLVPYRLDQRLLLDVQQVIPLPEAEELMVRLRQRETAARAAEDAVSGRDWTKYVITGPAGDSEPLPKRHAVLELVHRLHKAGVPATDLAGAIPGSRFLPVDGLHAEADLGTVFVARYPRADGNLRRWQMDRPIIDAGRTWILSKMWGANTVPTLEALIELAPEAGISYRAAV